MPSPTRMERKVHKLYLSDLQSLHAEEVSRMLEQGAVEIIVAAKDGGAWGETLGTFFDALERSVEGWREKLRNKAVIVNFVDPR